MAQLWRDRLCYPIFILKNAIIKANSVKADGMMACVVWDVSRIIGLEGAVQEMGGEGRRLQFARRAFLSLIFWGCGGEEEQMLVYQYISG